MAIETPVARWVFNQRDTLKPEMTDLSWPKSIGLDVFDIESIIVWGGKRYVGRGAAKNLSLAIEKACTEALERLACHHNGVSSTGVAAHSDVKLAEENAILEAKERYALNWHIEKGVAPAILNISDNFIPHYKIPTVVSFQRFSLTNSSEKNSCISIYKANTQYFLGLSAARTISEAILKADLEALRNVSAYLEDIHTFSKAVRSSRDLWCCDNNYIEKLLSGVPMKSIDSIPSVNFCTKRLTLPDDILFKNVPIHIIRAETGE